LRGPVLDRPSKIKDGPVIIDTFADGDTSGRFSVAKIAARLFPIARSFVEQVRKEGLDDAGQYVFAPWSTDKLVRLCDFVASYVTRSGTAGLGTVVMEPSPDLPVSGIVLLRRAVGSDAFNLEHLAIRLPLSEQQLSNAILIEALTKAQKEAAHDEAAGGANARPKSACEGILRHNQNGFWIDVPPEGACEINKDEENKVLAACNVGHYCKIEGELQDCEDSGECSEIHKITHVSRRKH
jgi:hypothetical protein